jgi:hypothetical protein
MFSSEQKFSVNGEDKETLLKVITLALEMSDNTIKAYSIDGSKIFFYWHQVENSYPMPATKNPDTLLNLAWDHIKSDESKTANNLDKDLDIDGSTYSGWEVFLPHYTDNNKHFYVTLAVKRTWIYYAK